MDHRAALSLLGTMMQRAGLLSAEQIAQAKAHGQAHGTSVVEAVLALGLRDENALCEFFHNKLMIPRIGPAVLQQVDRTTLDRIPGELARRHMVLPVSADDTGNLTLAMADPTDMRAVDAVANHTSAYLVRAVAPLSALREAIEQHYPPGHVAAATPPPQTTPVSAAAPQPSSPAPPPASVAESQRTSRQTPVGMPVPGGPPPPPPPFATGRTEPPPVRSPRDATPTGWNPPLSEQNAEPEPLSPEAFGRVLPRLVQASSRDEIIRVLLDFLGAGFKRVILFTHRGNELQGRDARGPDLIVDAVKQVRIPDSGRSVFADVLRSRISYFGPLRTDSAVNRAFAQALGGLAGNVLVLPVTLGEHVPLLVFASDTSRPVDPRSIQQLSEGVSNALARLIMRQKRSQ